MKKANVEKQEMDLPRKQRIARRIAEMPKKYRKIYRKAVEGNNKDAAIQAFCLECVCWQKNEITNCPCLACPLYGLRPYIKGTNNEQKKNAAAKKQLLHV